MKITIVAEDKVVGIDKTFRQIDLTSLPAGVRAVQFDKASGKGHVEYLENAQGFTPPNKSLTQAEFDKDFGFAETAWQNGSAPIPEPNPDPAVTSVTPWQFRKALNQTGLRQQVEEAVATSTDQNLKDGWEFATTFVRNDPLVVTMGQALGKTEAELDSLFELAKAL